MSMFPQKCKQRMGLGTSLRFTEGEPALTDLVIKFQKMKPLLNVTKTGAGIAKYNIKM